MQAFRAFRGGKRFFREVVAQHCMHAAVKCGKAIGHIFDCGCDHFPPGTFDKIAVALNFYFELGVDERKVYFHSVWHRARKPQSELDGLRELNPFLNALYHMLSDSPAPDWPTNSSLRRVRHQLTHRNHLLHWREEEVESPRESTVTAFRQKTLFLLRNTKAAIIYLVCALILAEQGESEMRRVDESPRLLPVSPSSLRWYDWFTEDDEQES